MKRPIHLLLCAMIATGSVPAFAAPDAQWVYLEGLSGGSPAPSAVFLSSHSGTVLFRANCDRARKELVLTYYGDGEAPLSKDEPLIITGSRSEMLETRLLEDRLEGRAKVTPRLLRSFSGRIEITIIAPNALYEPWHVGKAEPLKKIARTCR